MQQKAYRKWRIVYHLILLLVVSSVTFINVNAQSPTNLPLAEPGPYHVATQEMVTVDASRYQREIAVTLWYPVTATTADAPPDFGAAPYPLILYTIGQLGHRAELQYLTQHLATYGFVVAALERKDRAPFSYTEAVDRPLDVLFVLNQLAAAPPDNLIGLIDTNRVGVMGYSFGGYTSVAVSGARWDDSYHVQWCTDNPGLYPTACPKTLATGMVGNYRAESDPRPAADDLWPAWSDTRIKAVLPMGGSPGVIFGERGLAAATVPMLLMAGTEDTTAPYQPAGAFVYQHWGAAERYLLSFVGANHMFGYTNASAYNQACVTHFATAFFGYYLQGQTSNADYLTKDYVDSIDGLAWGVYGDQTRLPITRDNLDQIGPTATFRQDTACIAAFNPVHDELASAAGTNLTLWDTTALTPTLTIENDLIIGDIAFSPDGSFLALTANGNTAGTTYVQLWNTATGELRSQWLDDFEHMATSVAFSPDGTRLAAGTGCAFDMPNSAFVKVWELATGTLLLDIPVDSFVHEVTFSPDGTLLAAIYGNGTTLWEVASGNVYTQLEGHTDSVLGIVFSPDGSLLASSGIDGIRLWSVASGEQLAVLETPYVEAVDAIAFSPDGTMLIAGDSTASLIFWDIATGTVLATQPAGVEQHAIFSVGFNADGTLLVSCGHDEYLRLFSVR